MKSLFVLLFAAVTLSPAFGWSVSTETTSQKMTRGEWKTKANVSEILLKFDRIGSPMRAEGRKNQFTISIVKDEKTATTLSVKARITEDISLPEKWLYSITTASGKEYILVVLKVSWDGENPASKPLLLITDGSSIELKKYSLTEKFSGAWDADILKLLSSISHQPIDQAMKDAVSNIAKNVK